MINSNDEILERIGEQESETLEYKAILPPSRTIAQLIASFANSKGGDIILGIFDNLEINGLDEDVHAVTVTNKAIDLLMPKPIVTHRYIQYKGKKLYAISIKKSNDIVSLEGKIFSRSGTESTPMSPLEIQFKAKGLQKIKTISEKLAIYSIHATSSKQKYIEHYQSVLKIIDDLGNLLYPNNSAEATTNLEGKILTRILFSSCVDNFETFLSELLYEIFLAKPETLKSEKTVSVKVVLNCSDIEEFVSVWAKELIGKLQKGSVKGFLKDTKQISELDVLDDVIQNEIEKILQIRHLYSHRNGIIDDKFLQYFPGLFVLGKEHQMSTNEFCNKIEYLADVVDEIDKAAIAKFSLATN